MRVLKFGGSSVRDADRIKNVGDILQEYTDQGIRFTAVFSDMGCITDLLISMATKASKGKKEYKQDLDHFIQRHNEVIENLFDNKKYHAQVMEVILEQHETLR